MTTSLNRTPEEKPAFGPRRSRLPLHTKILLGLLLGAAVGLPANYLASRPAGLDGAEFADQDQNGVHDRLDWWALHVAEPLGRVFLRLIFMAVIPLVFSALALAAAGIGGLGGLGRLGMRTLFFTLLLSVTAVGLGVGLVNLFQPGHRLNPTQRAALQAQYGKVADEAVSKARQAKSFGDTLLDIIPENPLQEMVGAMDGSSKGNGMLAVMFFALVFGAAATATPERTGTLIDWLEGLNAVSMTIIGFAMRLAPFGVACLTFAVTARLGLSILAPLAGFVLTVLLGLTIQLAVVYPLVLWWFGRTSPLVFFRSIAEAMITAFGTASSNATLPISIRVAQENLRLPRNVSNFVLTIGATGNQNGTALYEGVVVLFLAQVFGHDLSLSQQMTVVLLAVLAGVGTAGVPGGSLPLVVVVLQSIGIPGASVGIILGIDRVLDMCRTVLNVTGDLTIATCVARGVPHDPAT
jgi:DAACS family dicarboxylate/amino acid:cation (Na+ or H+) symporter